jgi:hypothetical protein
MNLAEYCWDSMVRKRCAYRVSINVLAGVRAPSLLLGQSGDELAAEVGDVGDQASPNQVRDGRETLKYVSDAPRELLHERVLFRLVWTLVWREAREEAG